MNINIIIISLCLILLFLLVLNIILNTKRYRKQAGIQVLVLRNFNNLRRHFSKIESSNNTILNQLSEFAGEISDVKNSIEKIRDQQSKSDNQLKEIYLLDKQIGQRFDNILEKEFALIIEHHTSIVKNSEGILILMKAMLIDSLGKDIDLSVKR
jgi:predicted nuclease with TOPRIM domain